MNHGWWWHVFNDPIRGNWAALGLLVVILAAYFLVVWFQPWRRR